MSEELDRVTALIQSDPNALEHYLVLADLLQARGDPLGELIALHSQVDSARLHNPVPWAVKGKGKDVRRVLAYFDSHREELLKELEPYLPDIEIRWRFGFVHGLRCPGYSTSSSAVWRDRLDALLQTRACNFLYALQGLNDAVTGLARLSRHAPGHRFPVRRLHLAGSSNGDALLDACRMFPDLEALFVGGELAIDQPPTTLRELDLGHYHPVPLENFWNDPWPDLERLRLRHVADLPSNLLAASHSPSLRSLELGICGTRRKQRDVLVRALLASPLVKQLNSLHIYEVPDYAAVVFTEETSTLDHLESFYLSGSDEAKLVTQEWTAKKKSPSS